MYIVLLGKGTGLGKQLSCSKAAPRELRAENRQPTEVQEAEISRALAQEDSSTIATINVIMEVDILLKRRWS